MVLKRRYGLITNHKKLYRLCRELQLPRPQRPKNPHHLGLTCQAEETANALREAVRRRKPEWQETKPVIRTDNGPQFIGRLFEETCEQLGLELVGRGASTDQEDVGEGGSARSGRGRADQGSSDRLHASISEHTTGGTRSWG